MSVYVRPSVRFRQYPPFAIRKSDVVCFLGDSITGDPTLGGWFAPLMATINSTPGYAGVRWTGGADGSGDTTGTTISLWSSLVTAFEPFDTIVIELGINDVRNMALNQSRGNPNGIYDPSVTDANVRAILTLASKYRQIMWCGPAWGVDANYGEAWRYWGRFDTADPPVMFQIPLNLMSQIIGGICAETGQAWSGKTTYVDWRASVLAWERAHNTGNAGNGVATVDGIHPNVAVGKPLLSSLAYSQIVLA